MEPNSLALFLLCLVGAGALVFLFWLNHKIATRGSKKSVSSYPVVMSRPVSSDVPDKAPSSLQTAPPQTDQTPIIRRPPAEELLTVYRLMRKYGIPREEARAALKAANLPLDNNLWTSVAPPVEEPQEVTPIAGRPTSAKFHDDPELEYRPLR